MKIERRSLLKAMAYAFLTMPVIPKINEAFGASLKVIDKITSKRLKYVANVTQEAPKIKKFKEGDSCLNCKFYKRGRKTGDHWSQEKLKDSTWYAKCSMAQNKYVARQGYCKVYSWDKKAFPKKT